jgi:hypothetical protein
MRATDVASPGAGAKRLINDALDGPSAAAAFGAATKTAIKLLRISRKVVGSLDRVADVVVAQHVAGTHNH